MIEICNTINDLVIITPKVYNDHRGYFLETYVKNKYSKLLNLEEEFIQDNRSYSHKNILRGLHYQKKFPQGKLVTVVKGEIFDVAVDIRKGSNTYGKHEAVILNDKNFKQFWIPPGFAHGFVVLSEDAIVEYKVIGEYVPKDEGCIIWNDKTLNINWPTNEPILSEKDLAGIEFLNF